MCCDQLAVRVMAPRGASFATAAQPSSARVCTAPPDRGWDLLFVVPGASDIDISARTTRPGLVKQCNQC